MSQPRVAVSLADRVAARLSRDRPWAKSQPTSGNRNRPALPSHSPVSTKPQSTSSIQMNRLALRPNPPASTQSQSISRIRMNRPALRPNPPASTQSQSISRIRMNRPALQPLTTTRLMPSTVDAAKSKAVLEKAQARRDRLAASKPTDASHVADKPLSAIISDVRRVQARLAAYEARKAERTHVPEVSRKQGE